MQHNLVELVKVMGFYSQDLGYFENITQVDTCISLYLSLAASETGACSLTSSNWLISEDQVKTCQQPKYWPTGKMESSFDRDKRFNNKHTNNKEW